MKLSPQILTLALYIALLFLTVRSLGQNSKRYHFGIQYSYNYSSNSIGDNTIRKISEANGFCIGLLVEYTLAKRFSIQAGLNYLETAYTETFQSGALVREVQVKGDPSEYENVGKVVSALPVERKFNYLEVPISLNSSLHISPKDRLFLQVGLSALYQVNYNQIAEIMGEKIPIRDHINHPGVFRTQWNLTYSIGIGYERDFLQKYTFFIKLFLQRMFFDMEECFNAGCDVENPRNRWFGLQVGIKI